MIQLTMSMTNIIPNKSNLFTIIIVLTNVLKLLCNRWLHPVYVTSGIMLSKLVYSILFHKTPQGCRFENSVFLFSFGTHLGVQIWVTFISGN
jgi:hypothetical protein